ncbi:hypothetical protein [Kitasatospora aburaviensis]|uniref:Uncharacterized protein n=1 Tax=Kitasatospora aburaviensis TaxID=67265 RepID=A0ABW1F7K8_9ACTN
MSGPVEVWRLLAREFAAGRRVFAWTAGPDGQLAVLLGSEEDLTVRQGITHVTPPCDVELVTVGGGGEWRTALPGITVHPHHLALLPGGRTLLAAVCADELPGGWERNAVVYGPDGQPAREFTLGEDVQALVTDQAGRIWIAYGEEGVYGHHPASQDGLQGMDSAGRSVWRPRRAELPDHPQDGIAAATEGRAVWLAWLAEEKGSFLTRVDPFDGTSSTVPLPVRLPTGFAIAGDRAVFLRHPGELVRCRRVDGAWKEMRRERLDLPGELDGSRAFGRSGVLWFRMGNGWYRVEA